MNSLLQIIEDELSITFTNEVKKTFSLNVTKKLSHWKPELIQKAIQEMCSNPRKTKKTQAETIIYKFTSQTIELYVKTQPTEPILYFLILDKNLRNEEVVFQKLLAAN